MPVLLVSVNIRCWWLAGGSDRSLALRLGAITTGVSFVIVSLESGAILLVMGKWGKPLALYDK